MTLGGRRRRLAGAGIAILICGLTLVGTALLAPSTRAMTDQEFHDAFKQGCEAGGNSFVENPDGSYQCNLKDGGVIKCTNASTPCTYTKRVQVGDTLNLVGAGNLQVAQGPNPTATPTKPARSVIGGIVATIGPAKLPPEPTQPPSGNRSGIFVNAWQCPGGVTGDEGQLLNTCKVVYTINFEVTGPIPNQFPNGGIAMQALPAGNYRVREFVPNGYSVADAFCGVAPSEDQQPVQYPVIVYDGYYEFTLGQDQSIYCNWFNVPLQGAKPTRVVGGVLLPGVTNAQVARGGASPVATLPAGTPAP